MSFKVALIQCPAWSLDMPPLGLACIAGSTATAGHEVTCYDFNIGLYRELDESGKAMWNQSESLFWEDRKKIEAFIETHESTISSLASDLMNSDAKIFGFSINQASQPFSLAMARRLKQNRPEAVVVFGGPATHVPGGAWELIAEPETDFVIVGEGEESFPALLKALEEGTVTQVKGVYLKQDGVPYYTGDRECIRNMDELPIPLFTGFPLSLYRHRRLPVMLNRGCRGNCAFCSDRKIWGDFRSKTAAGAVAELSYLVEKYQVREFDINDSTINSSQKEFTALLDKLIAARLDLSWGGFIKPLGFLDEELLQKMAAAGCRWMTLGVESGAQSVVNAMRKGFRLSEVERIIRTAHRLGIKVFVNFMVGFPNERKRELLATAWFIFRNRRAIDQVVSISHCGVIPGMEMAQFPERFGITFQSSAGYRYWEHKASHNNYRVRWRRVRLLARFVKLIGFKPNFIARTVHGPALEAILYRFETEGPKAVKALKRYVTRYPHVEEGWILLARASLASNQPLTAVRILQSAMRYGETQEKWRWLGRSYRAAEKSVDAEAAFKAYRTLAGDVAALWRRRAEALFYADRWDVATETVQRILDLAPELAQNWPFARRCLVFAAEQANRRGFSKVADDLLKETLIYFPTAPEPPLP